MRKVCKNVTYFLEDMYGRSSEHDHTTKRTPPDRNIMVNEWNSSTDWLKHASKGQGESFIYSNLKLTLSLASGTFKLNFFGMAGSH